MPGGRVDQARLVASTVGRNLVDDPLGFALLVGRRFGSRKRGVLSRTETGLVGALGAYLADRPEVAARALRSRRPGRATPLDRIAARLAVAVGDAEAIPPRLRDDARVRSDQAWTRGELTQAVAALGDADSVVARRRRSELALLQPGFRLQVDIRPQGAAVETTRVLHILTNSKPHTQSGYTARSHAVLRAQRAEGLTVAAATRIGYPVTIGTLNAAPVDWIDGIAYHRLLAPGLPVDARRRLELQVAALDPLVEAFGPGVIHTTTDFTNALVAEAVARRHHLPWVYEMRGQLELTWIAALPEPWRADGERSERVRLLRAKEAELAAAADAVVVLSEVQAEDLVSRGVARDRISVVPNSIDPTLLARTSTPAQARADLGLPTDGVWAGTVSSLVDYEGLDTFLRALAEARRRGIDLRGAIVGDGVSRPGLIALARELGIEDKVLFPGRVPAAEAIRWHEALDMFVVPRRNTPVCRMVTPMKPVEAMALGRPVVASDLPALHELVGRDAGTLVPADDVAAWADALGALAQDTAARAAKGEAGRSSAVLRTWQHGAVTYAETYRQLGVSRG